MYQNFKLGADPEVFVRNTLDGSFISGHNLIPGTKWDPHMVDGGAVQVDGLALEFNTMPAIDAPGFMYNVMSVYKQLNDMVKEKNENLELVAVPVADFEPIYFDNLPLPVKELGCEPDFDAYKFKANPRPQGDRPFRTASGHIHVGWITGAEAHSPEHFADCAAVVQELDAALFLPSLLWDPDNRRRTLYGARGAFRPKSYGVEYRVLSNAWLNDPLLMTWIFDSVDVIMGCYEHKFRPSEHPSYQKTLGRNDFTRDELLEYLSGLGERLGIKALPDKYVS